MQAAAAGGTTLDALPRELAELVTKRLPGTALLTLLVAGRHFGQQPTLGLVSRLTLDVATLNLSQPHQQERLGKLPGVTTLQLKAAQDGRAATYSQLPHVVELLTRHVPLMPRLSRLDLVGLPLDFLVEALSCLGATQPAPAPMLAAIHITSMDGPSSAFDCGLAQLWPALARLASLRTLHITHSHGYGHRTRFDEGVAGITALHQLRSLSIDMDAMRLARLPGLPNLSLLRLSCADELAGVPGSACLVGYGKLQDLELQGGPNDDDCAPLAPSAHTQVSWATLSGLTRLALDCGDAALPHSLALHLAHYTALVRLKVAETALTVAQLRLLPSLTDLTCGTLALAAARSTAPPALEGLDSLQLHIGFTQDSGAAPGVPVQSLSQTFPRLRHLSLPFWRTWPPRTAPEAAPTQLWPPGPPGQMRHLAHLCIQGSMPLPFAQAAVGVTHLVVRQLRPSTASGNLSCLRLLGPRLRKVVLGKVGPGIGDSSMCALVHCCPLLEEVTLSHSTVTDVGLAQLARAPRLHAVEVKMCPEVTVTGVAALAAKWSVDKLRVDGCPAVTVEGMRRLVALLGRPQLVIHFPGLYRPSA